MVAGCYKIPNIHVDVKGVYTNTAMVDAYRGAGRPEAAFVIERICDLVADATGIDPAEVRRRNFIQPEDFPYDTGVGMLPYDSGNYEPALDKALEAGRLRDLPRSSPNDAPTARTSSLASDFHPTSKFAASRPRNGSGSAARAGEPDSGRAPRSGSI